MKFGLGSVGCKNKNIWCNCEGHEATCSISSKTDCPVWFDGRKKGRQTDRQEW